MAVHARATATQQLPALPLYTGEEKQAADDGLSGGLKDLKRDLRLLAGTQNINCTN